MPGKYTVTMASKIDGVVKQLAEPMPFNVTRLYNSEMNEAPEEQVSEFWRELELVQGQNSVLNNQLKLTKTRVKDLNKALLSSQADVGQLEQQLVAIQDKLDKISHQYAGSSARGEVGVLDDHVTAGQRLFVASIGTSMSTYGPTPTHKESLAIAKDEIAGLSTSLNSLINNEIKALEQALKSVNAPWVKGQAL